MTLTKHDDGSVTVAENGHIQVVGAQPVEEVDISDLSPEEQHGLVADPEAADRVIEERKEAYKEPAEAPVE